MNIPSTHIAVYRLLLLLSALLGRTECSIVFCQAGFENPVVFGPETGLGDGYITAVAKDHLGFMWIGTTEGLYRFDGSGMQVFRHDPNDLLSLSDNHITDIVFDSAGQNLWITTSAVGFNVMDIHTGNCRRYTDISNGSKRIESFKLNWVITDRKKRIWLGSDQGLVEHNPLDHTSKLHTYPLESAGNDSSLLQRINLMLCGVEDRYNDSLIWIGSGAGLLAYNKNTGKFRRYLYPGAAEKRVLANSIRRLYQDSDGALYCGTYYFDPFRFDPASGDFRPFQITGATEDQNHWRNISCFAPKSPQELWVTTFGGLAVLNTQTYQYSIVAKNDPLNRRFWGVKYKDEADRLWTWDRDKLILFNPLYQQFQHFRCPESVSGRDFIIRKVEEDPHSGLLYLAAQLGDGLYILNRHTGKWAVIPPELPPGQHPESFQGWDILRTRGGEWLVLAKEALYKFSPDRKKLIRHPFQPPLREAFYRSMAEDYQGNLWIGSHYEGLIRLNLADGSTRIFKDELAAPGISGSFMGCWHVLEDRLHQIWVRHSKGYSVYRPAQDTFYHLHSFGTGAKAHVECFAEDRIGRVWIVGGDNNLCIADSRRPELGLWQYLTFGNPLKSYKTHRLLVDQSGRIWVGAGNGVECVSNDMLTSTFYPISYGIGGSVESMKLLSSGEIALGHRTSVSIFHPDRLINNHEKPQPYLTLFKVFQQEYKTDTLLPHLQRVHLEHNQNYFSIEFSALGYNLPGQQTFEYQLQGADPDWIKPEKRRYAAYTNLPSGDYVFALRVANNEGVWCDQPLRLHIHIATPWWNTWWAWCVYIALIGGTLYTWYWFQLRRQLELTENRRLKELDTVKTRLYTNITHEFRTPLTIIDGMAEQIKENPVRWLEEGLDMIQRNSQNLLGLVNQMLELRKLEAGMLPVQLAQGDIVAYVKYLLESFHSYAATKNIALSVESQWESFRMDYDPDKILTIVSNLLSNAIKFTPAGGTVTLKIGAAAMPADPQLIHLSVQDTGIGIPSEELPHIFDRFHQVEGKAGGTGIGLTLAKELAQLLGGAIRVESTYGQGAVFTVTLPVSRLAEPAQSWQGVREKVRPFMSSTVPESPAPGTALVNQPLVQIVEDNADVVRYLRACLEPTYRLMISPNGKAALEQAFDQIPDLIVSDVMMPEMDGFELCQTLKTDERTNHIPIILLTARVDTDSRLQGLELGADACLTKPFNKEELLLSILNLLESRHALQMHYLTLATTAAEPVTPTEENAFVLKVRGIVEAHLNDADLDVERLCREVGMSNSNLHRKLTALTGHSANHFIRYTRLTKACTLLRNPELTIAAVTYDCGFNDPVYFARIFKQEFGVTPSEWRGKSSG